MPKMASFMSMQAGNQLQQISVTGSSSTLWCIQFTIRLWQANIMLF